MHIKHSEREREREITLERVSQYKNKGYPTIFKATPNIFLNPLFFFFENFENSTFPLHFLSKREIILAA